LPGFGKPQDGVNGFLLCPVNKTTGIDDNDIGIISGRFMLYIDAITRYLGDQHLRIHQVLRTSQRDNIYLVFPVAFGFQNNDY
jgi:hypothetical protein